MNRFTIREVGTSKVIMSVDTERQLMQLATLLDLHDVDRLVVQDTKSPGYEYPLFTWVCMDKEVCAKGGTCHA